MSSAELPDDPTSEDMADARTAWAEDRTLLANERTFAAWMRTGMACVALALGLRAVFGDTDYPIVAKLVAEIFILAAVMIFVSAARSCGAAQSRITSHDAEAQPTSRMTILACVQIFGAIAVGVILWLL